MIKVSKCELESLIKGAVPTKKYICTLLRTFLLGLISIEKDTILSKKQTSASFIETYKSNARFLY